MGNITWIDLPWPVPMLSAALENEVELNELAMRAPGGPLRFRTFFHRPVKPAVRIIDYLVRIVELVDCSEYCYVLAFVYLRRFLRRAPQLRVDAFSVHHLLFVCFVVAVKFLHNTGHTNSFYASVGCLPSDVLNHLEVRLLVGVNYQLFVSVKDVLTCIDVLRAETCRRFPPAPERIYYHPPAPERICYCPPEEEQKAKERQGRFKHRFLLPHEIMNPHTIC